MPLADYEIIESFLLEKLAHCDSALRKLQQIPAPMRESWVENAISYWRNARGAMAWALGSARQRARIGK